MSERTDKLMEEFKAAKTWHEKCAVAMRHAVAKIEERKDAPNEFGPYEFLYLQGSDQHKQAENEELARLGFGPIQKMPETVELFGPSLYRKPLSDADKQAIIDAPDGKAFPIDDWQMPNGGSLSFFVTKISGPSTTYRAELQADEPIIVEKQS